MPRRLITVGLLAGCLAGTGLSTAAVAAPPAPTPSSTAPQPSTPAAPTSSYAPPQAPSRTVAPAAPVAVPAGGGAVPGDPSGLVVTLLASGLALAGGGTVLAARRRS